jgi:hypothetical protein
MTMSSWRFSRRWDLLLPKFDINFLISSQFIFALTISSPN